VTARVLVLSPSDNVAVALSDLSPGALVEVGEQRVRALEAIPQGHKISLADMDEGASVVKYGSEIGHATRPIARGAHVHVHNIESARLRGDR
jgi:altronate hydrolase